MVSIKSAQKNLEIFTQLEALLERLKFGTVDCSFQIHDGRVVGIQGIQFQRLKFKEGKNSEAVAGVLAFLKKVYKEKKSGVVSFSVKFDKGQIKEVLIQKNFVLKIQS